MSLATLAELKQYLGIKADNVDTDRDALLTRILATASAQFENAIGRTLAVGPRRELRSGTGGQMLLLRDWPVTSVSSLNVAGVSIPAIPSSPDSRASGYFEYDGALYLRGYCFARGLKNVEVNYTAGYETIPADVNHAIIELSALAYKEKDWVGFISKSLAGETVTFDRSTVAGAARTNSAAATVNEYKRNFPCD